MKFIHFGCWNKGLCDMEKLDNGISKTMKKLHTYDVDFIIISGDNYYPDKTKENGVSVRMLVDNNFTSGFECLPKNPKKYMLYGNHDIEDIININGTGKMCTSITKQIQFNNTNNYEFFYDVIFKEIDNITIIMIDTTLYDSDETLEKENTCYKYIFPNVNGKLKDLIAHQNIVIKNILLNTKNKIIIFAGHHPIISIKNKNGNNKTDYLPKLKHMFLQMNELLKNKNVFYLCADTHYYQQSQIFIKDIIVNQYIVGTGGADQDDIPSINSIKYDDITYNIINQIQDYGFIVVSNETPDTLNIEFIVASSIDMHGGDDSYFKYLKYKNKYLSLKKLIYK